MKLEDLKVSDLHRIIEKKLSHIKSKRTIEIEEITSGYIALNYIDDTGNIMDIDCFDVPIPSDEEPKDYVLNFLYETIECIKILIDAIEPQNV